MTENICIVKKLPETGRMKAVLVAAQKLLWRESGGKRYWRLLKTPYVMAGNGIADAFNSSIPPTCSGVLRRNPYHSNSVYGPDSCNHALPVLVGFALLDLPAFQEALCDL
jgi:hypothetical protein